MQCRTLSHGLVGLVLVASTALAADDAADSLSAAMQGYMQFAAEGKWSEAEAMLQTLSEQHPDSPAVKLMREHFQLRRSAYVEPDLAESTTWDELTRLRRKHLERAEAVRQRMTETLEGRVDVDFDDATLESVMRHVAGTWGLNVVLDEPGLNEAGATPYTKVTVRVNGVRLSTVLELVLEPLGLAYAVQDEVIKVTSRERLAGPATTRVYAVGDLVQAHWSPGEQADEPNAKAVAELQQISQTIRNTVDPNGWSEVGGSGYLQIHEGTLSVVIRQTPAHHEAIAELLSDLRARTPANVSSSIDLPDVPPAVSPAESTVTEENQDGGTAAAAQLHAKREALLQLQAEIRELEQQTGEYERVLLHCRFVEADPSIVQHLGLKSNADDGKRGPLTAVVNTSELEAVMATMRGRGDGKLLAHASLITANGRPGSVFSGGEFPILIPQEDGTRIEWREFGHRVDVLPTMPGGGRIQLDVSPEYSERDFANAVELDGRVIPGLHVQRVQTRFELDFEQSGIVVMRSRSRAPSAGGEVESADADGAGKIVLFVVEAEPLATGE
jgi:hypothetical protein